MRDISFASIFCFSCRISIYITYTGIMYYNNKQCFMPLQNTKKDKRLDRQLNVDPLYKVALSDFSSYCHQTPKGTMQAWNDIKQCALSHVWKGSQGIQVHPRNFAHALVLCCVEDIPGEQGHWKHSLSSSYSQSLASAHWSEVLFLHCPIPYQSQAIKENSLSLRNNFLEYMKYIAYG